MSIQLGDLAPDFEADSTQGRIRFHEWLGNDWGVFFSDLVSASKSGARSPSWMLIPVLLVAERFICDIAF